FLKMTFDSIDPLFASKIYLGPRLAAGGIEEQSPGNVQAALEGHAQSECTIVLQEIVDLTCAPYWEPPCSKRVGNLPERFIRIPGVIKDYRCGPISKSVLQSIGKGAHAVVETALPVPLVGQIESRADA